jgi:alpha-ketoglutaric semialdehyde dehydrogenase
MQSHGGKFIAANPNLHQELTDRLTRSEDVKTYSAYNPATGELLPGSFKYSSIKEVDSAVAAAADAYGTLLELSPTKIASFLVALATSLLVSQERIIERCTQETALPASPRLTGELQRVGSFLNIYAEMILKGEVSEPRLTSPLPDRLPLPRADIRMCNIGIGPVAVIEASNFPFAFGVVGNDTASAWAAGCPVVAKAHPLHPGTSEIIATVVHETIEKCGLPPGFFSMLHGDKETVEALVLHPDVRGIGFTGSKSAGDAIRRCAALRSDPIELSLELGSVNPLFVFEDALRLSADAINGALSTAALNASGQFCTSPGVVMLPSSDAGRLFLKCFTERYINSGTHTLLGRHIAEAFESKVQELSHLSRVNFVLGTKKPNSTPWQVAPAIFSADIETFRRTPLLRDEIFGPAIVFVLCQEHEYPSIARLFVGELTATIHSLPESAHLLPHLRELHAALVPRVGRLIYNGYPTGVELCPSMYHGGPWPSSSSRFSAVGPDAINRWVRRMCFQNTPDTFLPESLQSDIQPTIVKK